VKLLVPYRSENHFHYDLEQNGEWVDVPDEAVVKGPNRDGRALVWPMYEDGHPRARCFMPGSMT